MLEVAEIIRLHGEAYRRQYGSSLSSVQKRALRDISACRTPLLGGHVYLCGHCQEKIFSYHSCRNRSCPKCHRRKPNAGLRSSAAASRPVPTFC